MNLYVVGFEQCQVRDENTGELYTGSLRVEQTGRVWFDFHGAGPDAEEEAPQGSFREDEETAGQDTGPVEKKGGISLRSGGRRPTEPPPKPPDARSAA